MYRVLDLSMRNLQYIRKDTETYDWETAKAVAQERATMGNTLTIITDDADPPYAQVVGSYRPVMG